MKATICIPSRLASTRLPEKPLLLIAGRPLVAHVLERARECRRAQGVIVATDSERIASVVRQNGGDVVMTDPDLPSGTDRVAAVAAHDPRVADDDVVVNFQGDQPLLPGTALDDLLAAFGDPTVQMATLVCPLPRRDLQTQHTVKVVLDRGMNALYFSRSAIPHVRDPERHHHARFCAHIGVYAYRKRTLLRLAREEPCALEQAEALEQLRALWMGIPIRCVRMTTPAPFEINTPEDLARAEALFSAVHGDGRKAYERLSLQSTPEEFLPFV